jgi:hypothetical protein
MYSPAAVGGMTVREAIDAIGDAMDDLFGRD